MVSIKQTFTIPTATQESSSTVSMTTTRTEQYFDGKNATPSLIGLGAGSSPTKAEPGSYVYTGMHDHGSFPPPNEGGPMALVIGCATAAQEASDKLLTEVIEAEKKTKERGGDGNRKRSVDGAKKNG